MWELKYEIPLYISSEARTVCVGNSNASESQTVVNESIYNGNSYFILEFNTVSYASRTIALYE